MSLRALQRQWDRFGRRDPLWAVLSVPGKRHGRWDEAEFFATGTREIEDVLAHARGLGWRPGGRALDFGCGVGRLTQALAGHFERCDGVDIAPSMVSLAERYDRHAGRVRYHVNARPDLSLFEDRAFSFVYTSLVLQHMPPALATGYIREFVRVLAPAGLLVFHLPSQPFPEDGAGGATRTRVRGPLPRGAFRASLEAAVERLEGRAGQQAALKLRVRNQGGFAWPALGGPSARHQVKLAGRFLTAAGDRIDAPEARSPLPCDVAPGATVELYLLPPLPSAGGDYLLEVDLVQEGVAWFHEKSGAAPLRLRCRAEGGTDQPRPRLLAAPARPAGPSFRERYPLAHELLARRLRLPELRNAALAAAEAAAWHGRIGFWRAREAVRRVLDPPMQMNGIPRADVLALLADSGARLLEAERSELTEAGWQAYRYWATRDA